VVGGFIWSTVDNCGTGKGVNDLGRLLVFKIILLCFEGVIYD